MSPIDRVARRRFRVWIVRYDDWEPENLRGVPPRAVALEPAERGTMSASEAASYAEAFNRAALATSRKLWAIAIPVQLRYEGDPRPGEVLVLPG
jgi:hypothetical protein